MLRSLMVIAAASTALISSPSLAQSATDARCLVLSYAFARSGSTPDVKKAAQSTALFYLGKIDGRFSDAQLRATLVEQQKTIVVAKAGPDMQGCVRRMQESEKKLQAAAPPPAAQRK
jgi:hypothetical protein